ncbi:MAG: phosphoglucosamine mutase [Paracoccaceae bacterium]
MSCKLFGTDGVRGRANIYPMTAETVLRIASAAGHHFKNGGKDHRVVIGKDTRLSGYMLETALTAGFTSAGMDVFLLGPVPTPAVSYLTHSMRADLGVMISASHNPSEDNGIKFFGPDGFKLSDAVEAQIEALMETGTPACPPDRIGRARRLDDARGRYVEYAKTTFPGRRRLDGLRIVVDCAHGAAWRVAPEVLWELGAEVIPLGVAPDGTNINLGCGSTHPEAAVRMVRETRADLGICLDGDADRLMLIDETGRVADGDQIMGLIATRWAQENRLAHGTLVATVMSNLGLERYLNDRGIALERTAVGDRYVVERMRATGANLGGEQSGHIVMTDYGTTGDGLIGALQFLATMVETGRRASELTRVFEPVPQLLTNIRLGGDGAALEQDNVREAIEAERRTLEGRGRLLIRKSGTEPLIRVMAEAEDPGLLQEVTERIVSVIEMADQGRAA